MYKRINCSKDTHPTRILHYSLRMKYFLTLVSLTAVLVTSVSAAAVPAVGFVDKRDSYPIPTPKPAPPKFERDPKGPVQGKDSRCVW